MSASPHFAAMTEGEKLEHLCGHITAMGVYAGRRIMSNAVVLSLDAALVKILVDDCCHHVRFELIEAGGSERHVDVLMEAFELAVVREGKRIAQGLSPVGGTA